MSLSKNVKHFSQISTCHSQHTYFRILICFIYESVFPVNVLNKSVTTSQTTPKSIIKENYLCSWGNDSCYYENYTLHVHTFGWQSAISNVKADGA
jgi:hypothetical protein